MNKLNDTSSANLKVLGENELSQVVGGWGRHGGRGSGSHMSSGRRNGGGGGGGRSHGGGNVSITFNITINNINNNNLF